MTTHRTKEHLIKNKRKPTLKSIILKTLTTLSLTFPSAAQKIQKLAFSKSLQQVKSPFDSPKNTLKIPISELFFTPQTSQKPTYTVEGEGNLIRSQSQNPISTTDFSKYNYAKISIIKKVNESSIISIFDSQEIGIQHVDGNFSERFGDFERGEFYEKGREPDCHDFARDGRFDVVHVLCFFMDRRKGDFGLMMVYSIFDGTSVRGIKDVQLDYLVVGRKVLRLVQATVDTTQSDYLLSYTFNSLTTQDSKIEVDLFGLDPKTGSPNNKDYLKQLYPLPESLKKVTNIFRRKNRQIVLQGIDTNNNQILLQCTLDITKGFNCQDGIINPSKTQVGLIALDYDDNLLVIDSTFKSGHIYSLGQNVNPTSPSFYRNQAFFVFSDDFSKKISTLNLWYFEISKSGVMLRLVDEKFSHVLDHVNYVVKENVEELGDESTGFDTEADYYVSLIGNDIFKMSNKDGFYTKNIEEFLELNPQDFSTKNIKIEAKSGTDVSDIEIDFEANQDFYSAAPSIPEMADLYTSTGTEFTFLLKRDNFEGNDLSYTFEADLKNKGLFVENFEFTRSLNISIDKKVQGYSFSNDYVGVWSFKGDGGKDGNFLDVYFCNVFPGSGASVCNFVVNVTLENGEILEKNSLSVNYTSPVFLIKSGNNEKIENLEKNAGFQYKLKFFKTDNNTQETTLEDLIIAPESECQDFLIQVSLQANNLFLCIQNSKIQVFNLTIKPDTKKVTELDSITSQSLNLNLFCPKFLKISQKSPLTLYTLNNCFDQDSRLIEISLYDDKNFNIYYDYQKSVFLQKKSSQNLGYDFCTFRNEILIFDFDNQVMTSYDSEISTQKIFSSQILNFEKITKIYCSNIHSVLAVYGISSEKKFQNIGFLRANNDGRNFESRRILYKTRSKVNGMNEPYLYTFGGSLAITFNFGNENLYLNEIVLVNEFGLVINTIGQKKSDQGINYSISGQNSGQKTDKKTGVIYVEDVPNDLEVKKISNSKLRTSPGLYYLEDILDIQGPRLYVNLSRKSNHIQLSPALFDSSKEILPFNLFKTWRNLATSAVMGLHYFIVYNNYRDIVKSPRLDKNSNGVLDLEILYSDDSRTQILSAVLNSVGYFNCSVSFFESKDDFDIEKRVILKQDGGCYTQMRLRRFRNNGMIIGFFKEDFTGKMEIFNFVYNSENQNYELLNPKPVVIQNVDQFSVLNSKDQQNFTVVYNFGATLSTVDFNIKNLENPTFTSLKPKIKFLANDIKCAEIQLHCVADAIGNRLFHFWPLNYTGENYEIDVRLVNKFDNFYTQIKPTTLAINTEFVAYYSLKIPTQKEKNLQVAVQIFDVSNQTLQEYNITNLVLINNFTQNSSAQAQAAPFGFVALSDLKGYVGEIEDDYRSSAKSFIAYYEGGATWSSLRKKLFLNFTTGFYRDSENIFINIVGMDNKGLENLTAISLNEIFDIEEYKLRWYYWVAIILGGSLILGSLGYLLFGKIEKDEILDDAGDGGYKKAGGEDGSAFYGESVTDMDSLVEGGEEKERKGEDEL